MRKAHYINEKKVSVSKEWSSLVALIGNYHGYLRNILDIYGNYQLNPLISVAQFVPY
jgi:hypothetical protein